MSGEPDDVVRSLREVEELTDRTRRAGLSAITGLPLLGWGLAFLIGLPAVEHMAGFLRIAVVATAWIAAMVLSWWPGAAPIRTGTEPRMHAAWFTVFAASPFFVAAARPESFTHAVLFLAALWGLAMALYGIATSDRVFAVIAGSGVVVAGLSSMFVPEIALTVQGVLSGLPLAALGAVRMIRGGTRV